MHALLTRFLLAVALLFSLPAPHHSLRAEEAKPGKVRLFILSGQSNMAKMDPEVSFIPAINKAYPQDDNIFIKVAKGGEPIRNWVKADGTPTGHFLKIQSRVEAALKDKAKPETVAFTWMQGEADAKGTGADYRKNLEALLALLQKEFGRDDIVFVLGRINDYKKSNTRKDWATVREAQVSFAEARDLSAWVNLDEFAGRGLHYSKDTYKELGKRFADKTVELLNSSSP